MLVKQLRSRFLSPSILSLMLLGLVALSDPIHGQTVDSVAKPVVKGKAARVLYGTASFYAKKFQGRKTASGERFNHQGFTCACNMLPFGTWVRITNLRNGKQVVVKVNDRLHPKMKRLADLTLAAAQQLGFVRSGLTRIKLEVLGRRKPR